MTHYRLSLIRVFFLIYILVLFSITVLAQRPRTRDLIILHCQHCCTCSSLPVLRQSQSTSRANTAASIDQRVKLAINKHGLTAKQQQ